MLKQTLLAALVVAFAGAASAQNIEIKKDLKGGAPTWSDGLEAHRFWRQFEVERQVILRICEEHMFWRRTPDPRSFYRAQEAVTECAARGEREYILNYRFSNPFLTTVLTNRPR